MDGISYGWTGGCCNFFDNKILLLEILILTRYLDKNCYGSLVAKVFNSRSFLCVYVCVCMCVFKYLYML